MPKNPEGTRRGYVWWLRSCVILALGLACWLSRMPPAVDSATLILDPCYQQALGVALKEGLRFGREIVFTSGPLAYFTYPPYDPDLYGIKLWLWDVLLGGSRSAGVHS